MHLTTNPPHKRMRAVPRRQPVLVDSDSECDSNSESEFSQEQTAKPGRFMDGVLEHY